MENSLTLQGATIVTRNSVIEDGEVRIEHGLIVDVRSKVTTNENRCAANLRGTYLLPGLIDSHSDIIENALQPRLGASFRSDLVLPLFETHLLSCGITTVVHALPTLDVPALRKSVTSARTIIDCLMDSTGNGLAGTHLVSVRCELTDDESVTFAANLKRNRIVRTVSLEDHTPKSPKDQTYFQRYCRTQINLEDEQIETYLKKKKVNLVSFWSRAAGVAAHALKQDYNVSAHDVCTAEDVERFSDLGVLVCEFPTSLKVAERAKALGMKTVIGAPNLVTGGSQVGNVKAEALVAQELVDVICSDYHPPSLLASIFRLWQKTHVPLYRAVAMSTANAAAVIGVTCRGSIEPGHVADLLVVRLISDLPFVERTYVGWKPIYDRSHLFNTHIS